jgi:hypothetical protein
LFPIHDGRTRIIESKPQPTLNDRIVDATRQTMPRRRRLGFLMRAGTRTWLAP